MTAERTTTIHAIVWEEDDQHVVSWGWSGTSMLGPIPFDGWFNRYMFDGDVKAARAFADRLVLCDTRELQIEMSQHYSVGSYQGCWNAPIVYETSKRHTGGEPWRVVEAS